MEHKNNIVYLLRSDSTINVDNYFQSILDALDECYDDTTVATRSSNDGAWEMYASVRIQSFAQPARPSNSPSGTRYLTVGDSGRSKVFGMYLVR